MRRVASVYR